MHDIFIKLATAFLEKIAKESDNYTTEKSTITVEEDGVTLSTPDYLQFAVYGRGPGKNPPLDNIMKFVKAKGIIFDGMDQRGTAFAIQASIGIKGTSNWQPNAPNALSEFIKGNLGDFYDILNVEILDSNSKSVNEVMDNNIPTQVKFKI